MDIEFHYYITHLIAARAGFAPDEAQKIAYSAQYVDENGKTIHANKGLKGEYISTQSQAFDIDDIPRDKAGQLKVYSVFHFIPGNPNHPGAARKDKRIHVLNTTPDSANAQKIFMQALQSNDIYRIGIAAHGYVDTWAHQNFIGCADDFNNIIGLDVGDAILKWALPDLGHAEARHYPDYPAAVWHDPRLALDLVDNKQRFLEAAESLFLKLCQYRSPGISADRLSSMCGALLQDLNSCLKVRDDEGDNSEARIRLYVDLSKLPEYGGREMAPFDEGFWFNDALNKVIRRGDDERMAGRSVSGDYDYFWKDTGQFSSTDWFRFQNAAKQHQLETIAILKQAVPAFKDVLDGTVNARSSGSPTT